MSLTRKYSKKKLKSERRPYHQVATSISASNDSTTADVPDLPSEILTKILSSIVGECRQFQKLSCACRLSILCRRFRLLLRPLIFRKIIINVSLSPAKCVLLLRTLKENPDLSHMIHLLDISWNIGDADTGDHERANELLGALPYLRELSVKADWDKIPFQP
jgi:hypothetical protein